MKVARFVGARPQFMQVPPLMEKILEAGHRHILVHTGQHYDANLSDVFFRDLGIPEPNYNLNVGSGSHGKATGIMLERTEQALQEIKPDVVVVDGDTNSTLAAALAAAKLHIPVVHVEAGLRDFDRRRPEEINRIATDHCSDLNCAPIPRALQNLANEGLAARSVLTGDVLLDCLIRYEARFSKAVQERLKLAPGRYHVLTLHRPENTDFEYYDRFCDIMGAVGNIGLPVIFPVHPRTQPILQRYIEEHGGTGDVRPIPPLSYFEILGLVSDCEAVFTDSGGLPREATWLGRKCVMLFKVETWHDLLKNGWAQIGMTDRASIEQAFERSRPADRDAVRRLFGDGMASQRIVDAINVHIH